MTPTTDEEMDVFFKAVNNAKQKPGILKVVPPYCESYIPKLANNSFPKPVTELYNPEALHLGYIELISECEKVYANMKVHCKLLWYIVFNITFLFFCCIYRYQRMRLHE